MDPKLNPIEGQSYHFTTNNAQLSTPKTTGKRKKGATQKNPSEERLTLQESLYQSNRTTFSDQLDDNEQAVSTIKYTGVTIMELRE